MSPNSKKYRDDEKSNASVWNTAGGHQDVPAGQGVPEYKNHKIIMETD